MTAPSTTDATDDLGRLLAGAPSALADPWPIWRALREAGRIVATPEGFWVTRYDDVRDRLRDPALRSGDRGKSSGAEGLRAVMTEQQREAFDQMTEFAALFVVQNDGEEHTRLRRIAQRAFTPKRIGELRDATERYVREILDTYDDADTVDLKDLAYRVPLMIIGDLLGVPPEDRERIKDWSSTWFSYRHVPDDRILDSAQAGRDMLAYVQDTVAEHRRSQHGSGLIADLVAAEREERVTADELAAMFFVLLFAGHETTTNLIATGAHDLLQAHGQWETLRDHHDAIPYAVEELLRYITPVQWAKRVVTEDVEICGEVVPAGSSVQLALAAANRDPAVFPDPDRLDVTRPGADRHVAFGFGAHFCLGASLARLEGAIALRSLAERFPDLRLATDTFEWVGAPQVRSLAALPVHPGPEARR